MMRRALMILAAVGLPSVAAAQAEFHITVPSVRVRSGPPPVRVEVQPERRSADQQWIAGHWARRGNTNTWIAGVWTRPPHQGMVWEKEEWSQRSGNWYYAEGHWRYTNPTNPSDVYEPPPSEEEIAVTQAPPRDIYERRPGMPFRGAVWIKGYWGWDGAQYEWVAGHWSAPQRNAAWAPDRWQRKRGQGRGQSSQWVLQRGHWRNR